MRGFAALGLWRPKHDGNFGGILRAAHCYGVSLVAMEGARFRREPTDTPHASQHLPVLEVDDLLSVTPVDCTRVAVELIPTATALPDFWHPPRAIYLFGPEDGSLPDRIVSKCRHVVYVPTRHCMNLAAAVNVLLYDRLSKASKVAKVFA